MKNALLFGLVTLTLSSTAFADPTVAKKPAPPAAAASATPTTTIKEIPIEAHAARPNVVVDVQRQSAAQAAGAAHEAYREAQLKKLEPASLKKK